MNEEVVVVKVRELLGALDEIKRYNELAKSIKKFAAIVGCSIAALIALRVLVDAIRLSSIIGRFESVILLGVLLLIPLIGIVASTLYISRKVNAVAQDDEWETKLNGGLPAALEVLSNLDWSKSIEEVSESRITYSIYGMLKFSAYGVFIFFCLDVVGGLFLTDMHLSPLFAGVLWAVTALLAISIIFGRDMLRRYKEVRALNLLLEELRSFAIEFERAEFKQR